MGIVGGIDIHRRQLTFDLVDLATGESVRGHVSPADRVELRRFLAGLDGAGGDMAMEGCTGWRYVTEELECAGFRPHVAEPADTAALRGNKRRAKTDRGDAQHLRKLLMTGELPESWIPPRHVLEARAIVRLYKDLADQRVAWTSASTPRSITTAFPSSDVLWRANRPGPCFETPNSPRRPGAPLRSRWHRSRS